MKRNKFIFDMLIYWVGRMGSRVISFFLLPIYTVLIVPADWGILNILMITVDLAALLIGCQLPVALYRHWTLGKDENERRRLSGLIFIFSALLSTACLVPMLIFAEPCATLLGIEGHSYFIRILVPTIVCAVLVSIIQAEMRVRGEAQRYALFDILQNVGMALINIFLVVVMRLGIWGILLGQFVTFSFMLVILLPSFISRADFNLDRDILRQLLRFSLPLVPSGAAMAAIHNIDRYFIQFMRGPDEVGLYSIGYKFGTLVSILVLGPFLLLWEPKSYEIAAHPNAGEQIGKIFINFTALLLFIAIGLCGAAHEIIAVMTSPQYHDATHVLPLITISYVLFGMDAIGRVGLLVHQKTRTILSVVLITCGVNLLGNALFVPAFGMMGAAWVTLVSFGLLLTLDLILSQRYLPIIWEWRRLAILGLTSVIVSTAMTLVPIMNIWKMVALKMAIMCAYPLLLLAFGFIKWEILSSIKHNINSMNE